MKARLTIQSATRIVVSEDPRIYLHVRIGSREAIDRVRLEVSGPQGAFAIPQEALSKGQPCGERSTCLALTLGPGASQDADRIVLSVPDLGHEHRAPLRMSNVGDYGLTAEAIEGNARVRLFIDDPLQRWAALGGLGQLGGTDGTGAAGGLGRLAGEAGAASNFVTFERSFQAAVQTGACGDPPAADSTAWRNIRGTTDTVVAPFADETHPFVCVWVRPAEPLAGPSVVHASVTARAVVTTFVHVYLPAAQTAPLVFLPFFDLELPTPERCSAAEGIISATLMETAERIGGRQGAQAESLMLDPVRLAEHNGVPCRQANERRFNADAIAAGVHATLDARFSVDRDVRVLVVYVGNLGLEPPDGLIEDFARLRDAFNVASGDSGEGSRDSWLFTIASDRAAAALEPDQQLAFGATEEPAFREAIARQLETIWPFRTMLHGPDTVVPLVDEPDRGRFSWYRICDGPATLAPIGEPRDDVLQVGADGPAYRVTLPLVRLAPPTVFALPVVQTRWQGCERLCGLPAPGRSAAISWRRGGGC